MSWRNIICLNYQKKPFSEPQYLSVQCKQTVFRFLDKSPARDIKLLRMATLRQTVTFPRRTGYITQKT